MKNYITFSLSFFAIVFLANLGVFHGFMTPAFASSNEPVDINVAMGADGSSSIQAFETTPNDSLATTDPGDDQSANNQVVRAGDVVTYRVEINLNHQTGNYAIATFVATNGKFNGLPTFCLTDKSVPSVTSNYSTISADNRTVVCNTGMIVEGTTMSADLNVNSDFAPNGTPMSLTASVTNTSYTSPVVTTPNVAITSRPSVNVRMIHKVTIDGSTLVPDPAYGTDLCKNGTSFSAAAIVNLVPTCPAGSTLGDTIQYIVEIKHGRLGSSRITSPLTHTFTTKMQYTSASGAAGWNAFNPELTECAAISSPSSGTASCTTDGSLADNSYDSALTITGMNDTLSSVDGVIGRYSLKYFIPRSSYAIAPYVLQTTNVVYDNAFDPNDNSGTSNYGVSTELAMTCVPGVADLTADSNLNIDGSDTTGTLCDNRNSMPLASTIPGGPCPDANVSYNSGCAMGQKVTKTVNVSPGQTYSGAHISYGGPISTTKEANTCSQVPTDAAGNMLYTFNGKLGENSIYHESEIAAGWQHYSANYGISASHANGTMIISKDDNSIYDIGWRRPGTNTNYIPYYYAHPTFVPAEIAGINYASEIPQGFLENLYKTYDSVVIEFSQDPVPANSTNDFGCSTGTWQTWTGDGSLPTGTYTKIRAKLTNYLDPNPNYFYGFSVYPELTINPNPALFPASAVPLYASSKGTYLNGAPHDYAGVPNLGTMRADGWMASVPAPYGTAAERLAFKGGYNRDVFNIVSSMIRIEKTHDSPYVTGGDTINYEVQPYFEGAGTTTDVLVEDALTGNAVVAFLPGSVTFVQPTTNPAGCPSHTSPTITFPTSTSITVTFTAAVAGCALPKIRYSAKVDDAAVSGMIINRAEISTPNDTTIMNNAVVEAPLAPPSLSAITYSQVRGLQELHIEKRVDQQYFPVDNKFDYTMRYKNTTAGPLGDLEFVDVLPYNGDKGLATSTDRDPPSNYQGILQYLGSTLPAGVSIAGYTQAAPGTINLDPKCASNNAGATWIDATTVLSSANPNGNDWTLYCPQGDTATNWIAGAPPVGTRVTGMKYRLTGGIAPNLGYQQMNIQLQATDNIENDIYTNNFSARTTSMGLPVISNDVWVKVYEGEIGNKIWWDTNEDGDIDTNENPTTGMCVKLEVDASDASWAAAHPLINKTKLNSGPDGLYGTADDLSFVKITDANGNYLFDHLPAAKYKVSIVLDPASDPACAGATLYPSNLVQTYDLDDGKTKTPTTSKTTLIDICSHYDLVKDSSGNVLTPEVPRYIDPSTGFETTDVTIGKKILLSIDSKSNNDNDNNGNILGGTNYSIRNCAEKPATFLEDADFGFLPTLIITGHVYHDNGVIPSTPDNVVTAGDELPIENVTLTLMTGPTCTTHVDPDGPGPLTSTTTTSDIDGLYEFENLLAGTYCVVETQPAGYKDGLDQPGNEVGETPPFGTVVTPDTVTITLVDKDVENVDFLEIGLTISGHVFHDNGMIYTDPDDDVTAGNERPIPNVTITLMKNTTCSTSIDPDGAGPLTQKTTTTDTNGYYEFTNLAPGDYCVVETQPTGFKDGAQHLGNEVGSTTPYGTNENPDTIKVLLVEDDVENEDFLEIGLNVSGFVYHDNGYENINADNLVTINRERPIPNTMITLKLDPNCGISVDPDGAGPLVELSKLTNTTGYYIFKNLPPGTVCLVETQPAGYKDGAQVLGNEVGQTAAFGTTVEPDTIKVTLASTDVEKETFLEIGPDLKGYVLHDNGLLISDPDNLFNLLDDAPIPNTTLTLKQPDCTTDYDYNDTQPGTNNTNLTTNTGAYAFLNLLPGTYCVVETQPFPWKDGADIIGSVGGTVANDRLSNIVLNVIDSVDNVFLEIGLTISGFVYHDNGYENIEADHLVTPGRERPLDGELLTLKRGPNCTSIDPDRAGPLLNRATLTSVSGAYEFRNLPLIEFCVVETQPAGYKDGAQVLGNELGIPNDRVGLNQEPDTERVVLVTRDIEKVTFLEIGPDLKGYVLHDNGILMADPDNLFNLAHDAPIWNVNLTLKMPDCTTDYDYNDTQAGTANTNLTRTNGSFAFLNLLPGTYCVVETHPVRYNDGMDIIGSVGGNVANDSLSNIVLNVIDSINNVFLEYGADISGHVLHDSGKLWNTAGNEIADIDDAPISNIEMRLFMTDCLTDYNINGLYLNNHRATNASGFYDYKNLAPNTYCVREIHSPDWKDSVEKKGRIDNVVIEDHNILTNDYIKNVLSELKDVTNVDYLELGWNVSGYVIVDKDDDNASFTDPDLPLCAEMNPIRYDCVLDIVQIHFLNGAATELTNEDTNSKGFYDFINIANSTYKLRESQPTEFVSKTPNVLDIVIDGADQFNVNYIEVGSRISGLVYLDVNTSKTYDSPDTILDNFPIKVVGASITGLGGSDNTVSTLAGYAFYNMRAGSYDITKTQQPPYTDYYENPGVGGGLVDKDGSGFDIRATKLVAGVHDANNDFGNIFNGEISGKVFNGFTNDPIPGVFIELIVKQSDGTWRIMRSRMTDSEGKYSFTGLDTTLEYKTQELQPDGYVNGDTWTEGGNKTQLDRTETITLGDNASYKSPNNDYSEYPKASSLSGIVWHDMDRDGKIDSDELPIPGVKVTLHNQNCDEPPIAIETTDTYGYYEFTNLYGGTYCVKEYNLAGYADVMATVVNSNSTVVDPNTIKVTVPAGNYSILNNFGDVKGSIDGIVWNDMNKDLQIGTEEPRMSGVQLDLKSSTGVIIATTWTNEVGYYRFTGLNGDNYTVVETQPDAYESTLNGTSILVPLADGENKINQNFGEVKPLLISGQVWVDYNVNGVREETVYLPDTTINLYNYEGTVVGTTTTDANGYYQFPGLYPGKYVIKEVQPTGWGSTTPNTLYVNLTHVDIHGQDFGEIKRASIEGSVYIDLNDDGTRQLNEQGIPGVTLTLSNGSQTLTNADGFYLFRDLDAGVYSVFEAQPSQYEDGKDKVGSHGSTKENDILHGVTLALGDNSTDNDFGELYATIEIELIGFDPTDIPDTWIEIKTPSGDLIRIKVNDFKIKIPGLVNGQYELSIINIRRPNPVNIKYAINLKGYEKLEVRKDTLASTGSSMYLLVVGLVLISLSLLVRRYKTV